MGPQIRYEIDTEVGGSSSGWGKLRGLRAFQWKLLPSLKPVLRDCIKSVLSTFSLMCIWNCVCCILFLWHLCGTPQEGEIFQEKLWPTKSPWGEKKQNENKSCLWNTCQLVFSDMPVIVLKNSLQKHEINIFRRLSSV